MNRKCVRGTHTFVLTVTIECYIIQRCLDSEFSRKIDLWTFLDSPRSRIMKYPVLLKEVKKQVCLMVGLAY